ncbi:DnaB-like helicase C-terminal domain-containing protein [Sulfurimonas sp. HSL1-6]|uniref:DnaB-like helicase C-terminal domain-containing protein n=1 Tax=Thiomicrolovo immobilis TaxID=3131935 RepID=UPI0031F98705
MMDERLYNLFFERAVLSSVIFEPEQIEEIAGMLSAEDFYLPAHQHIFEVISALARDDKPVDEEFIRTRLAREGKFDEQAMMAILSANPISNVSAYIEQIKEKAQNRALLSLTTDIKRMVEEEGAAPDEIIGGCVNSLEYIADKGMVREDGTHDFISGFRTKFAAASQKGEQRLFYSGVSSLDDLIGGFEPGSLVVVGARPSMGKTALAVNMTIHALESRHGVYFDSLEMPGEDLMRRLIAAKSGESISDLKHGVCRNLEAVREAEAFFDTKNFVLRDASYITIAQLRARAKRELRRNRNIKYWFIDHLRYIKRPGKQRDDLEVSDITKELKKIAKEYGIVVVLLSQLNRANEQRSNKRPMLSDLRDSGAVEEDADVIIFPHRESYYQRSENQREAPTNDAELIVPKNRDGESGFALTKFNGPTGRFGSFPEVVHEYGAGSYSMPTI